MAETREQMILRCITSEERGAETKLRALELEQQYWKGYRQAAHEMRLTFEDVLKVTSEPQS